MGIDAARLAEQRRPTREYEYLKYSWSTTGFDGLEEVLIQLAKDFGYDNAAKRVLIPALRESMRPCLSTARAFIMAGPYNEDNVTSKHMVDTLKIHARQPTNRDKRSAYIKDTDVAMATVSVFTDKRAISQEFGNARVPAQPYLRRALEFSSTACVDQLTMILGQKISQYRAKQTKDKT